MKVKITSLVIACLVMICPFASSQADSHTREQLAFGAEDEKLQNPIPLPVGIKRLLAVDPYIVDSGSTEKLAPDDLPDSWFMASYVHLAGPDEKDVIVVGQCPICGANVAPFWVFRPINGGFQKILFTGALGIEVKRARTNGYRNIESGSVTMQQPNMETWRFDGEEYRATPTGAAHSR